MVVHENAVRNKSGTGEFVVVVGVVMFLVVIVVAGAERYQCNGAAGHHKQLNHTPHTDGAFDK